MEKLNKKNLKTINGGGKAKIVYTIIEYGSQVLFGISPTGEVISAARDLATPDDDFCDAEAFPEEPIADECDCSKCS
ncbi:MAG: hypothetical protein ACOC1S_00035 [bacterium]